MPSNQRHWPQIKMCVFEVTPPITGGFFCTATGEGDGGLVTPPRLWVAVTFAPGASVLPGSNLTD